MDAYQASRLEQSTGEGQTPAILCPMLQSLQIDSPVSSSKPMLMAILKEVVALRAMCGSPLKSVTLSFSRGLSKPQDKFELIGRDGGFTMEQVALVDDPEKFQIDI
jgi:hypothetical protein